MDRVYPAPVFFSREEEKKLARAGSLLARGVHACVSNYFSSSRLQELVPPGEWGESLSRWERVEYAHGWLRPDILLEREGEWRVCEINARFLVNGLYLQCYVSENWAGQGVYPELSATRQTRALLSRLGGGSRWLCKGREAGYDAHFLLSEHPALGLISPQELSELEGESGRLLLELQQDELAPHLDYLLRLREGGLQLLNDPRTVLIAHDKRLLSALGDAELMSEWLSDQEAEALSRLIIPTRATPCVGEEVLSGEWVYKRADSGKGVGMIFSYEQEPEEWLALCAQPGGVIQPLLEQQDFSAWDHLHQREISVQLAGTLSILGGESVGPGVLRLYQEEKFHALSPAMEEFLWSASGE